MCMYAVTINYVMINKLLYSAWGRLTNVYDVWRKWQHPLTLMRHLRNVLYILLSDVIIIIVIILIIDIRINSIIYFSIQMCSKSQV